MQQVDIAVRAGTFEEGVGVVDPDLTLLAMQLELADPQVGYVSEGDVAGNHMQLSAFIVFKVDSVDLGAFHVSEVHWGTEELHEIDAGGTTWTPRPNAQALTYEVTKENGDQGKLSILFVVPIDKKESIQTP